MESTPSVRQGHVYGTIYAEGDSHLTLGDVHNIQNIYNISGDTSHEKKQDVMQLLRYENMTTKRDFSMPKGSYGHDWIWKTKFPDWLSSASDEPFWICGKPGSGKSTIVAYLVHHNKTNKLLDSDDKKFQIISFFYDYRSGNSLANSIQGMLRMFLYQLADQNKEIRERLQDLLEQKRLLLNSTDDLRETTREALRLSPSKLCIFIDGLDEYEGNPRQLMQTCRQMTEQTGIKLCVASRPETQVSQVFKLYDTIYMQEHNKESMYQYAQEEVLQARITHFDIELRCTEDLIDQLAQKAEGVILWFKLAFDELLQRCVDSQSKDELLKFVSDVPLGMDGLYARILGIIKESHRPQAALILHLVQKLRDFHVDVNDFATTDLDHLSETYNFVVSQLNDSLGLTKLKNYQDMRDRIEFSLRGLLEFHDYVLDEDVLPSSTNLDVRYVHKTFQSYIQKANWVETHLPEEMQQIYPDSFWLHFFTNILKDAVSDGVFTYSELLECLLELTSLLEAEDELQWKHLGSLISRLASRRRSYLLALANELIPTFIDKFFSEIDFMDDETKFGKAAKNASSWVLSWNKPLRFPNAWKSRHAVLRTSFFVIVQVAVDAEDRKVSTYPLLYEILGSHLGIAISFEFFSDSAASRWILEAIFAVSSVRDIVVAMMGGLKGYIAERLAAKPLSESDQESLVRALIALLIYANDSFEGKSYIRMLAKHGCKLSDQNICFFLSHAGCCETVAEQARLLSKFPKSKTFSGHRTDCSYRSQGFGQLIHWVQHSCPVDCDDCDADDHETWYYGILNTLFVEEDINAYCYVGGMALQAILDHSIKPLPDRSHLSRKAKFLALVRRGLNPQIPSPRGKGLEAAVDYFQTPAWKRGLVTVYFKRDYDDPDDIGFIIAYLRVYEAQNTWPELEDLELDLSDEEENDGSGEES